MSISLNTNDALFSEIADSNISTVPQLLKEKCREIEGTSSFHHHHYHPAFSKNRPISSDSSVSEIAAYAGKVGTISELKESLQIHLEVRFFPSKLIFFRSPVKSRPGRMLPPSASDGSASEKFWRVATHRTSLRVCSTVRSKSDHSSIVAPHRRSFALPSSLLRGEPRSQAQRARFHSSRVHPGFPVSPFLTHRTSASKRSLCSPSWTAAGFSLPAVLPRTSRRCARKCG